VKVFGNDLKVLEERARAVAEVLRKIPGAADVYPEQVTGAPYLDIRVNREAAARYGITVGAVQDVIETAVGESNLMVTIEGRQRFPVRVRYAPEYRASVQSLGSVLVTAPNGTQVPLGQLADLRQVAGPAMISGENGLLVVTVLLNVRGRDVGSFVRRRAGWWRNGSRCRRARTSSGAGSTRTKCARGSGCRSSSRWCSS